jgi:hypothetical protein
MVTSQITLMWLKKKGLLFSFFEPRTCLQPLFKYNLSQKLGIVKDFLVDPS